MSRDHVIDKFRAFVAEEQETLGRLLFWAEHVVVQRTIDALKSDDGAPITFAELQVMQQLCLQDMRLTALAERMRMTKQAALQIVDGLERKGVVERRPDPDDGRAKVIGYTEAGFRLIETVIDATIAIEAGIAATIGKESLRALKRNLQKMVESKE